MLHIQGRALPSHPLPPHNASLPHPAPTWLNWPSVVATQTSQRSEMRS